MAKTFGACGFIGTGSSAVSDILKEFEENQALDKLEFKLAYQTDGLQSLKYHLTEGNMKYESGMAALRRFERLCYGFPGKAYKKLVGEEFERIVNDYLDSIIQVRWRGIGADPAIEPFRLRVANKMRRFNIFRYLRKIEKKTGKEPSIYPFQDVYFSVYPDDFDNKSKEFVMSLLRNMGWDGKRNIVLDQPFAGNRPLAAFPFFENPKAIIVDRDPRDYYLLYATIYYEKGWRQSPVNSVKDFISCYRRLREKATYDNSKDVLRINFEELVYNYEDTLELIKDFCGLANHSKKGKFFKPEMSAKNTQLFKKYPEFSEEIKMIEEELTEYLFDFGKYDKGQFDISGEMFIENPLNPVGRSWKKE